MIELKYQLIFQVILRIFAAVAGINICCQMTNG